MGCPLSLYFPEASSFNFYFILQDNLLMILFEFQVYSKVIKLQIANAGRDWGQEEKEMTEDEMAG